MCVTTYLLNNNAEKITIISTQGLHTLSIGRVDNDGNCYALSTVLDLDQVAELYENLGDFMNENGIKTNNNGPFSSQEEADFNS